MIKYILNFFKVSNDKDNINGNSDKTNNDNKPQKDGRRILAKILATLLAISLWFYVMNEKNPPIEVQHTIPLEIRNLSSNYLVVDSPNTVKVRIRGSRMVIAGLKSSDIKCFIDINGLNEGIHDVVVQAIMPPNVEFIESSIKTATVTIEPEITKAIPITIQFSGERSKEISVNKVIAAPEKSTIKGTKSLVGRVNTLASLVNISGKKESFNTNVSVTPLDAAGNLVEGVVVSPKTTTVFVELKDSFLSKTVQIKPDIFGNPLGNSVIKSVTVNPTEIAIKTATENEDKINAIEQILTEQIDMSKINSDTVQNVTLKIPEGMITNVDKVVVTIKLE